MSDFTAIALVVVAFVLAGVALAALGWVLAAARRNARLLTVPAHDASLPERADERVGER